MLVGETQPLLSWTVNDTGRAEAQTAIPLLFERFAGLHLDPQRTIEHKCAPVFNGLTAVWVRAA